MAKLLETIRQELDEAKKPSRSGNPADWHEHRIAVDTVKNPLKGVFLGGPSAEESEHKLRTKYGYQDHEIKKLKEEIVSDDELDSLIIEGGPTRKHFRQVASIIAAHPDQAKRKELAAHHGAIFASQNPRFNHQIWNKACGADGCKNEEVESHEDMISEVSEHDLMSRPDLHAAREHFKTAVHHSHEHSEIVKGSLDKYGNGNGVQISGIVRDHFPEHVKNKLRHHAHSVSHHNDLGMAARPKGVRHNTMVRLGQTVAKHHGPTGFYGFQPRNEEGELDAIYDSEVLTEEHEEHDAHHLVLHADNDSHLYHSSHIPVVKNLEKKWRKGIYDPEKAKKLWKYHADRAAQSYHKEHGDQHSKWHHTFSPATRHEAAAHWEKHHRHEMEAGNFHDH